MIPIIWLSSAAVGLDCCLDLSTFLTDELSILAAIDAEWDEEQGPEENAPAPGDTASWLPWSAFSGLSAKRAFSSSLLLGDVDDGGTLLLRSHDWLLHHHRLLESWLLESWLLESGLSAIHRLHRLLLRVAVHLRFINYIRP